ncbi:MAG: PstS family phosphate ABC transporter substrate-binding protein [Candidatus Eisenbacteria bacterium]|nr:PstS family phosphate ABC transporter substrate-binding protein [Candidatus Eisenbacteria bacterium]
MKSLTIILVSAALVLGLVATTCGQERQTASEAQTPKDALATQESRKAPTTQAAPLKGTITLSGAWALYPMVVRWAEEFQKLHPGVRMDIGAGGAGKGMADALAGVVDLGMVSRVVYPAEIERGAWWLSVTKDAVVPVINAGNPAIEVLQVRGATKETLRRLWFDQTGTTWGSVVGGDMDAAVRVYTRSDACGAAQTWAQYLGGTQEELWGVGVYGDPGLADAVKRDVLGVGFNNINYVYDATTKLPMKGLTILKIDLDGNGTIDEDEDFYATRDAMATAIASGLYPSPPARDLHFVAKGCPSNPVVLEFLRWVLTDGQAFVEEAGYIRLTEEKLAEGQAKLEP